MLSASQRISTSFTRFAPSKFLVLWGADPLASGQHDANKKARLENIQPGFLLFLPL